MVEDVVASAYPSRPEAGCLEESGEVAEADIGKVASPQSLK